ncbi:MAG: hypothetical protein DRJ50_02800 [Actinobacteria bacterium]|nr:MAG: hypothetical protein DRJ50_02800 [Actinomycetota bacterium]
MPPFNNPSRGDVHVNRPLGNISVAFAQEEEGFIADDAFPVVPVLKRSDRYFLYERGEFNRDEMTKRAPGTESAGGTYNIDNTPSYLCESFAFHRDIPDEIRDNADEPLNLDRDATEYLTTKFLIRKEKLWAATFFATTIWTNEDTGVSGTPSAGEFQRWDEAASTPIEDIRAARTSTKLSGGLRPNKLVVGAQTYDSLLDHPDIVGRLDRGQTSGPAIANKDAMAAIFELDQILIMDAIENTALEGATESNAFIGGKHALLLYAAPSPGIMTATAGYTFSWTGRFGASALSSRIKRFRMEHLESDRVEIDAAFDHKLVSADLGYFFLTAVN